jgi:putative ABC transport system permease protein
MGRRDVRRHRGRSVLILLMIGLPVLLITAGATVFASTSPDAAATAPYAYGSGQALIPARVETKQLDQDVTGSGWGVSDSAPDATPIPGYAADPAAAVGALVHGVATALKEGSVVVDLGGRHISVNALGVALAPAEDLGERAHLVSGRWPVDETEVVVTTWGTRLGLPTTGTVAISPDHAEAARGRTVVGVADAVTGDGNGVRPAAVVLTPWQEPTSWLITDAPPVTWHVVRSLNRHGLVVSSRALIGVSPEDLPGMNMGSGSSGADLGVVAAAATAMLLFTTALLAGPAFAISAIRQRRTLALSAANGATRAQIRRTVLAQAVVLGGVATGVAVTAGVGAVVAARPLLATRLDDRLALGVQVPWALVLVVAGAAMLSAVVAALVPSRALGRLDIVRALTGQESPRPAHPRLAATGGVLLGVGAALTLVATGVDGGQQPGAPLILGIALITTGALLAVPGNLTLSARWGGRLPLAPRMAVRDSARQRARTTPTVAAIMATAALFSAASVAVASDTAESANTYIPSSAPGTALVRVDESAASPLDEVVSGIDPAIVVIRSGALTTSESVGVGTGPGLVVLAQRQGCTWEQSLPSADHFPEARCLSLTNSPYGESGSVRVVPTAQLTVLLGLDADQQAAVGRGAIIVPDPATVPTAARTGTFDALRPATTDLVDGSVRFWVARAELDLSGMPTSTELPQTVTIPALVIPWEQFVRGETSDQGGWGAYLTSEQATDLGWPQSVQRPQLLDPDGPISAATADQIRAGLEQTTEYAQVSVERGFERDDTPIILGAMTVIALIILVATFVSTALSMAEQLPLMGTLAAVGATRMTRRKLAAAQAFHLAGLGALVGTAIGLLPGIAAGRLVTTTFGNQSFTQDGSVVSDQIGPFLTIPWLQIAAPVVVIPLFAAAFAFVSILRTPTVTRRAT